jgi:hypothetical protein
MMRPTGRRRLDAPRTTVIQQRELPVMSHKMFRRSRRAIAPGLDQLESRQLKSTAVTHLQGMRTDEAAALEHRPQPERVGR